MDSVMIMRFALGAIFLLLVGTMVHHYLKLYRPDTELPEISATEIAARSSRMNHHYISAGLMIVNAIGLLGLVKLSFDVTDKQSSA